MKLFHGTTTDAAESALREGLSAPSYWGVREEAEPYAEGGVLIAIDAGQLDPDFLHPNTLLVDSLEEAGDEDALSEWESCPQTWQDSLRIFGSVRYDAVFVISEDDFEPAPAEDFKP